MIIDFKVSKIIYNLYIIGDCYFKIHMKASLFRYNYISIPTDLYICPLK